MATAFPHRGTSRRPVFPPAHAPCRGGSGGRRPQRLTPHSPYARSVCPKRNTTAAGSHTHLSSLTRMRRPQAEKNRPMSIGETSIGRHGKKYRLLVTGANRATPSPPLVSISSKACDRVDTNKKKKMIPLP